MGDHIVELTRRRVCWHWIQLALLLLASVVGLPACREPAGQSDSETIGIPTQEGFFEGADGTRLFFRKIGSGADTAVYLHGGPANMSDGGYELDALANRRTLIAFDQRSGGRSELVTDPDRLTADYYVRDVEALRQHFALERMTLIGQSWGAGLAVLYASRYPERVVRLLLLSPMPLAREPYMAERVAKTDSVIGAAGLARIAEIERDIDSAPADRVPDLCRERIQLMFRAYLNDVASLKRMRVGYCDGSSASIRHEMKAIPIALASLGSWDFRADLATLRQPALVVEGADTHVPLEATRAWATALANARFLLVPGANHLTWLEGDVPSLMLALNQFLEGQWPEGSEEVYR
jgi:pimeloyl-ACP methyl ester carboxylesterase